MTNNPDAVAQCDFPAWIEQKKADTVDLTMKVNALLDRLASFSPVNALQAAELKGLMAAQTAECFRTLDMVREHRMKGAPDIDARYQVLADAANRLASTAARVNDWSDQTQKAILRARR